MFNTFLSKRKVHPKIVILLSAILIIGTCYATSYLEDFTLFNTIFTVVYGFGIGLSLMAPFYIGSLYYPNKKAILQGGF